MKKCFLKKYIITYFIMCFCMVSLKFFSCCLPGTPIKRNIAGSVSKMQEEGLSPRIIYAQIPYDNATDAEVLSVCWSSLCQKNKLIAAIDNVEYSYSNVADAISWLYNLVQNNSDGNAIHVVRHWMGITVPLKILFMFFDYTQIRLIIMMILFGLTFKIMKMAAAYDKYLSIGFFISIFAIDIASAYLTVNSYAVFLTTQITLIYYIKNKDNVTFNTGLFLFVVGGITSFLDLMSAPIMSYLYNVIFMFVLSKKQRDLKQSFVFLIKTGISWLSGYLSVWMMQWGLTSIVLKENIFMNAVNEMSRMVDGKILDWLPESKIDRIAAAIGLNKGLLLTSYFINNKLFILVCIFIGFLLWKIRKDRERINTYLMLMIVAMIPFGWFVFANNQSLIFYNLSFRIMGGTVMVFVYLVLQWFDEVKNIIRVRMIK